MGTIEPPVSRPVHEVASGSTEKRPIPDASVAVQAAAQNIQAAAGKAYEMLVEVQSGWLWKILTAKGNQ